MAERGRGIAWILGPWIWPEWNGKRPTQHVELAALTPELPDRGHGEPSWDRASRAQHWSLATMSPGKVLKRQLSSAGIVHKDDMDRRTSQRRHGHMSAMGWHCG